MTRPALKLCECGCGESVSKPRNRFVHGHIHRLRVPYVVRENGCWEWQGRRDGRGYGLKWLSAKKKAGPAHRWYYEQQHGAVPNGLELDHICRNRACVNPAHLRLCTHAENGQNLARVEPMGKSTSRFRGVSWDAESKMWKARVQLNGKAHWLGRFYDEEDAAEAARRFRAEHMPFAEEARA